MEKKFKFKTRKNIINYCLAYDNYKYYNLNKKTNEIPNIQKSLSKLSINRTLEQSFKNINSNKHIKTNNYILNDSKNDKNKIHLNNINNLEINIKSKKEITVSNIKINKKIFKKNLDSEKKINISKLKKNIYKINKNILLEDSVNNFNDFNPFWLGYSVNTTNGIFKTFNEDRVSIIPNIKKRKDYDGYWPKCTFFGLYDGHGGEFCAEFLKENLHKFIINSKFFPENPDKAIKEGFYLADNYFLKKYKNDISGSCALIFILVDNKGYFGNSGDSRAIVSINKGNKNLNLTYDHKPEFINEKKRIENAGGHIYQNFRTDKTIKIPFRIFPGDLSVSRSFGDRKAKLKILGGNPEVLISKPEVTILNLKLNLDFIILACDGIWDIFDTNEIIELVWNKIKNSKEKNINKLNSIVNELLNETMNKNGSDNLTIIFIPFKKIFNY